MNRTMVFAGIVIFVIVSWLVGFINTLDVDVNYGFQEKAIIIGDNSNYMVNTQGNEVLQLHKLSYKEKRELWNNSLLKEDMLTLFPRFSEMKYFIENHIEDDGTFKESLLEHLNRVELQYIGGSLTGQSAKATLSKF
jgi:hypothetical protein